MSRIIRYTEEQVAEIRAQFFDAIHSDPRKLVDKLDSISLSKGTYSQIYNGKSIAKRSIEGMKAFIERRTPKYMITPDGMAYCASCNQHVLSKFYKPRNGTCHFCRLEIGALWDKNNPMLKRLQNDMYRMRHRVSYLDNRRRYYLKRNYGAFWEAMNAVNQLKKELAKDEKRYLEIRTSEPSGTARSLVDNIVRRSVGQY